MLTFNHLPYVSTFVFYTIRDDFRDFLNTAAEHILKRTPLVDNKWMRLMNARFVPHQSLHQINCDDCSIFLTLRNI